ncbi:helix-turn-helix domain-containing protein [Kutzneria buriramensis]|uniref:Putative DNA-binding protein n=1 Tax=Kutzneria buriramensis TaxID=1045776 RepID=A0A3E0GW93_9PSEU|nr:ATP-binding protein [Kutzneria buriramensis]REH31137.1 putative DNA-binding protein [Kutzneria buriramensis]
MTSVQTLAACAAGDVTWERVRALVDLGLPESITLEYKSAYSPSLVKTVAAMANAYGGLVLVGVADAKQVAKDPSADRVVGVPGETTTKIAEGCRHGLEPPWQPEIVEVAVPGRRDTYVLVVRVDPARAPRPLLHEGKVPFRLHGANATAGRDRLIQLCTETTAPIGSAWLALPRPQLPEGDGMARPDYVLRSGMHIPVDAAEAWRHLSERGVDALAAALDDSPLQRALLAWCAELGISDFSSFRRRGFNRARYARLVWQAVSEDQVPIEVVAEAKLPGASGVPNDHLQFTLDVIPRVQSYVASRAAALLPAGGSMPDALLQVDGLHHLLDALLATLTTAPIINALAGLTGIDPVLIPQPASLDLHSGRPINEVVNMAGLNPIDGSGRSFGANLRAQPVLDLRDGADRHRQVDDWLVEMALDAGVTGMEALLDDLHLRQRKQIGGQ